MFVKSPVGLLYEPPVEPFTADARLVARHQKNRLAPRIESKRDSPDTIRHIEPQLFHVRVARPFESIGPGPAEPGADLFQRASEGTDFILNVVRQSVKLRIEQLMKLDLPFFTIIIWIRYHMVSTT